MRAMLPILVAVAVGLLWAGPAEARRKKHRRASDSLNVVVLPFVGKGTGGRDAKESVELELELVEVVLVGASRGVEHDLENAGRRAFDPSVLGPILDKRRVDVLIRGERGAGERLADALLVTAYGKDGRPRYHKELPLNTEPDVAAETLVQDMKPVLQGWRAQKPIRLPSDDGGSRDRVRPEDVLADDDVDAPAKKPAQDDHGGGSRLVTRSVLDDDSPPPEPAKRTARTASTDHDDSHTASPLDFNSDPADSDTRSKKHHASIDDPPRESRFSRTSHSEIDDLGRKHSVLDEASDTVKPPDDTRLSHALALSGAFDGATWYYGFDGGGVGDTQVAASFYPGGSALIDVWPLSFAGIHWIGLDGELGIAAVPFKITGGRVAVTPSEFTSVQTRAGVAVKLRYTLKNGIGLGVRAGYRYFGGTVPPQTINVDGAIQGLTVVPGYSLHAGAFGVELFLPILLGSHRLELEVRADGLPVTYYDEQPDNPGGTTLAVGWAASLAGRYDIASGFFLEVRAHSTGAQITYSDAGSRQALVGQQLTQLKGGTVLNLTAGFSTGLGFMF